MAGGKSKTKTATSTMTTIRVPHREIELLRAAAAYERRSLSNFLTVAGLERAERSGFKLAGERASSRGRKA